MSLFFMPGFGGLASDGAAGPTPVNTISLLHMDGAHLGTTFTDEVTDNTWVQHVSTPAVTSTTQQKFGTASLTSSSGAGLITSTAIDMGSGDFTVEFWWYKLDDTVNTFFKSNSGTNILMQYTASKRVIFYTDAYANYVASSVLALANTTWHHIAITKASGVGHVWINGVEDTDVTVGTINSFNEAWDVGCYTGFYLDEFRMSGIARYTGPFTPSAVQFEVD